MIKNKSNQIKQSKSAFTMIELIMVIVLLGSLIGVVITKTMGSSEKTTIAQTINTDMNSLISGIAQWKRSNGYGDYSKLDTTTNAVSELTPYIPKTLKKENDYFKSSTYGGNIHYYVLKDVDPSGHDDFGFKIYVDASLAAKTNGWSDETKMFLEDKIKQNLIKMGGSAPEYKKNADGIGDANDDFDEDGNEKDALAGVRKLTQ